MEIENFLLRGSRGLTKGVRVGERVRKSESGLLRLFNQQKIKILICGQITDKYQFMGMLLFIMPAKYLVPSGLNDLNTEIKKTN